MLLKIFKGFLALLLILSVGFVTLIFSINPNNYKPEIESAALLHLGLGVKINGDISWSLLPIGFRVTHLTVYDSDGKVFTALDALDLSVDTLSLLRLSPTVNGIDLRGGQINMSVDKLGVPNWERLLQAKVKPTNITDGKVQIPSTRLDTQNVSITEQESAEQVIEFIIKSLELSNFSVRYRNEIQGIAVDVTDLNISLQSIAYGQAFNASLSYSLNSQRPSLRLAHSISARPRFNRGFTEISLEGLESTIDYLGTGIDQASESSNPSSFVIRPPQKLSLIADAFINTQLETVSIPKIQISGAGLAIDGDALVEGFSDNLSILGSVSLAPFSLRGLLSRLGLSSYLAQLNQALNKSAFEMVSFNAPYAISKNTLSLSTFDLNVDQSNFLGRLDHSFSSDHNSGHSSVTLKGDHIDLSRYIPVDAAKALQSTAKKNDSDGDPEEHSVTLKTSEAPKVSPLFPVEELRQLSVDVSMIQDSMLLNNYLFEHVKVDLTAGEGRILLNTASADLLDGQLALSGSLNVQESTPNINIQASVQGVNALDKLAPVSLYGYSLRGLGRVYAKAELLAKGADLPTLLKTNSGSMSLALEDGAIHGVDLEHLVCQGFALLNRDDYRKASESHGNETATPVKALRAELSLYNGLVRNDSMTLSAAGFTGKGSGLLHVTQGDLVYDLDLLASGEEDIAACRVNEKFKAVAIPVNCSGSINKPSDVVCELNQKKLLSTLAAQAKVEAKRKIDKEVDLALDKHLDQNIDRYIEKDSELSKQLKDSFRRLFK